MKYLTKVTLIDSLVKLLSRNKSNLPLRMCIQISFVSMITQCREAEIKTGQRAEIIGGALRVRTMKGANLITDRSVSM